MLTTNELGQTVSPYANGLYLRIFFCIYFSRSSVKLVEQCVDEPRGEVELQNSACNSDNCNTATTAQVSIATTLAVVIGRIVLRKNKCGGRF